MLSGALVAIGRLLQLHAGLMGTAVAVALVWTEYYAVPGFVAAALLTFAAGRALTGAFEGPEDAERLQGLLVAALGWFVVGVASGLPFLLVAWTVVLDPAWLATPAPTRTLDAFLRPLNALFEGMSGVTGTGLTMTVRESVLPRSLQWWRSLTQWVGGIGVVLLAAAVVVTPGSGAFQAFYDQVYPVGEIEGNVHETLRATWELFVTLTLLSVALLWLAGLPPWHALNHGMTGIATGGFAVTDESIATYADPAVETVLLPIMALGGISFAVHHYVLRGNVRVLVEDLQTRWLFAGFLGGSALAAGLLALAASYPSAVAAARYGGFQLVSALTCTGFQTASDLGARWSPGGLVAVAGAMVVGGAAGSTAGGIKIVRAVSLGRGVRHHLLTVLDEERSFRMGEVGVSANHAGSEYDEAAAVATLWFVLLAVTLVVALATVPTGAGGHDLGEVLFEVASAQGNVGLSTGITGPTMPAALKGTFVLTMWIGRLEIVPVLVALRALAAEVV